MARLTLCLLPFFALSLPACGDKPDTAAAATETDDPMDTGTSPDDTEPGADADHDGFDAQSSGGTDCDDDDAWVNPGAEDFWYDGVDGDCAGNSDFDQDGDGYDSAGYEGEDCNDIAPGVHPGAIEVADGVDQNCDGLIDNGTEGYDDDGDGFSEQEGDCDDSDDGVGPGAEEVWYDGFDQDCGGDDDFDADGDGYRAEVAGGTDCEDGSAAAHPGISGEELDGLDNNCNGEVDEGIHCNPWVPTANGEEATRTYQTTLLGTSGAEILTLTSWDASTGAATLHRDMASLGEGGAIDEYWACDDGAMTMTGWKAFSSVVDTNCSYSSARTFMAAEDALVAGASWSYEYSMSYEGYFSIQITGTYAVIGPTTVTVSAGTFDALEITNTYETYDPYGTGMLPSSGNVTMFWVRQLGLAYSIDLDANGDMQEERELTAYEGFYP